MLQGLYSRTIQVPCLSPKLLAAMSAPWQPLGMSIGMCEIVRLNPLTPSGMQESLIDHSAVCDFYKAGITAIRALLHSATHPLEQVCKDVIVGHVVHNSLDGANSACSSNEVLSSILACVVHDALGQP
jgi:hypothetical protein